jgi:acetyl-CoA acetyltransferase
MPTDHRRRLESMSRAPFVMAKATSAFDRNAEIYDTTIGWRFVNPKMKRHMATTPCRARRECRRGLPDQPRGPGRLRAPQPGEDGRGAGQRPLAAEIVAVEIPQRKGDPLIVDKDEHPRRPRLEGSQLEADRPHGRQRHRRQCLGRQRRRRRDHHRLEEAAKRNGLTPRARVLGAAVAGVPPRIMGIGPAPAPRKLLEAPRPQGRRLRRHRTERGLRRAGPRGAAAAGIADDDARVNPNGGAIALGHPLGMSGARLALTATEELQQGGGRYGLVTMCIGVGQGIALAIERI